MASASRLALTTVGILFALAHDASAQTFTVRGRVEDAVTRMPVAGAAVTVDGAGAVRTGERGEYIVAGVAAGTRQLRVAALGYADVNMSFVLSGDTTIVVSIRIDPVLLDSIYANARLVRVGGRLTDVADARPVPDATILATASRSSTSRLDGRFAFDRVPTGLPFEVYVLAFSYEPVRLLITPENDTTIDVVLRPDTMMRRLIDAQIKRLDDRVRAYVGPALSVSREELQRYGPVSLMEALEQALRYKPSVTGLDDAPCTFVDEILIPRMLLDDAVSTQPVMDDPASGYAPERIERVEVYAGMVRIYTRRFMQRLVTEEVALARPSYSAVPRGFRGMAPPPQAMCR